MRFRPTIQVKRVTLAHPPDYFYAQKDYRRFRREAREETMRVATSPARSSLNVASSLAIATAFLVAGMMAATVACLPILLIIGLRSIVFSCAGRGDVDSSVWSQCPAAHRESSLLTDWPLMNLLGPSLPQCFATSENLRTSRNSVEI